MKLTTEADIKKFAAHLRKPEGEQGIEVAKMMNYGNQGINLHTLAVLNPQPNDKILEIGMGNGFFVKNIVNIEASIQYTGYDYSEDMVEVAKKLNQELMDKQQVEFIQGEIEHLPFTKDSFTKVFTVNTFYFWENPAQTLQGLKSVLCPEGVFILGIRPKHNMLKLPPTKYNFSVWSNEEILELFQNTGFQEIEMTEIKEPVFIRNGQALEREAVIISGKNK